LRADRRTQGTNHDGGWDAGAFEGVICACTLLGHAISPTSSWRKPGPITPGRSLAKISRAVLIPPIIDRPRGMGPGFRQDDTEGVADRVVPSNHNHVP